MKSTANMTARQMMTALCNSFHGLRGKPGTDPWNQDLFANGASGATYTPATRLAAAFVLSVWNGGTPRDGGWQAFLDWCNDPFWP